jgi:hypothetical protein
MVVRIDQLLSNSPALPYVPPPPRQIPDGRDRDRDTDYDRRDRDQLLPGGRDQQFRDRDQQFSTNRDQQFRDRDQQQISGNPDQQFRDRDQQQFSGNRDQQFRDRDQQFSSNRDQQFRDRDQQFSTNRDQQFRDRDQQFPANRDQQFREPQFRDGQHSSDLYPSRSPYPSAQTSYPSSYDQGYGIRQRDGTGYVCTCTDDLCNGGEHLAASFSLALLSIALAAFKLQ